MDRDAAPLRKMVDEGVDDLLSLVLALHHRRASLDDLAAERAAAPAPCWRLAARHEPRSESELRSRRFRKDVEAHGATSAQPTADAHNRPDLVVRSWLTRQAHTAV
jgi:hypothetical protein